MNSGLPECYTVRAGTLDVDAESLTGATRLYEKAGMRILWQKTAFELALREGVDLSTQTLSV